MMPLCVLFTLLHLQGFASEIIVPDDYTSIQAAIDAAEDGDTILVKPGTYAENVDFSGKAVLLRSEQGAGETTIDGNQAGSVVAFRSGEDQFSVLSGFTLTNGLATDGGGVLCDNASPTIKNNIISGSTATFLGGGVYLLNSSTYLSNNVILENVSLFGGGICCRGSFSTISNNTITKNSTLYGGGMSCQFSSSPTLRNNIFWDNLATTGKEIWVGETAYPSSLDISYCDVMGGLASIYVETGSTLLWGAGMIDADPLFFDLAGGDFHLSQDPCQPGTNNPCVGAGNPQGAMVGGTTRTDGVPDAKPIDMGYHYPPSDTFFEVPGEYSTIQEALDIAQDGSTILVAPGKYVENIDLLGKVVSLLSEAGSPATIIDGNQAGSAVTCQTREGSYTTIDGFTLTNGSAQLGGGILCLDSSPRISNCRIFHNTADTGGGIYCDSGSRTLISNMICHNIATVNGGGFAFLDGTANMLNNSVACNSAALGGGGIHLLGTTVTIDNTILWDNAAAEGPELYLDETEQSCFLYIKNSDVKDGQSSIYIGPCCLVDWGEGMIDADPLFVDEDCCDFHLTRFSPCQNAGDSDAANLPARDIENDPRIAGGFYGEVDIGADEFYLHVYHTGEAVPQQSIEIKVIGPPGETPVILAVGGGVYSNPLPTVYGLLYLMDPIHTVDLADIGSNGVSLTTATLPSTWAAGDSHPMQALVGSELTGLHLLLVE